MCVTCNPSQHQKPRCPACSDRRKTAKPTFASQLALNQRCPLCNEAITKVASNAPIIPLNKTNPHG